MRNRFEIQNAKLAKNLMGKMLVASPLMEGPYERSVLLVVQHNQEGTFGVVLNRPATDQIKDAWHSMTGEFEVDRCIVNGGPVGGPVFAIHPFQAIGEMAMPNGLFVSADSKSLQKLVQQPDDRYRIVFGVARWQLGQLESEIADGAWLPIRPEAEWVFDEANFMWENSLRRYGRQTMCDLLNLRELPDDPSLN